jgi:signal peptidase II
VTAIDPPAIAHPAPRPYRDLAYKSPRAWAVLLIVAALGLALDLGSKSWAFRNVADQPVVIDRDQVLADPFWNVPPHAGMPVLPWNLLQFQLVINRGAVFGIGANNRLFFIAFTLAALTGGLMVFGRMTKGRQHLAHFALGLIVAGGLGNLYDRIVKGVVRDFMHMMPDWTLPFNWHWWQWCGGSPYVFPWVFNVADVTLLAGMALLMLHINRVERIKRKAEDAAKPPRPLDAAPASVNPSG